MVSWLGNTKKARDAAVRIATAYFDIDKDRTRAWDIVDALDKRIQDYEQERA